MHVFGRAARNILYFQLKAVYNKTPLPIRIHAICQRGPGDTQKKGGKDSMKKPKNRTKTGLIP